MLTRWLCRQHAAVGLKTATRRTITSSSRKYAALSTASPEAKAALERTRNIGIIAHIDAGKTTTTERMLYYSGFSRRLGDVDEGSTVTDFLPAERARGITIQSAAITFSWPPGSAPRSTSANTPRSSIPHNINLIDTPGHADFTFEVLRSLRVLDGAVCILDGVAGVEAQTEKVWAQAAAYAIPRLIFVNKLDRDGAAFARTVKEIGARLDVWPALCEIPWWDEQGKLTGVGDVIGLKGMLWKSGGDGKEIAAFTAADLEKQDPKLAAELKKARVALVELLSEHDDEMVEKYLEADEDHLAITSQDIIASLRRCALQSPQQLAPVFAGASFRNIGVQPLLDAVVDLLPSPLERPDPQMSINSSTPQTTLSAFLSGRASPNKASKAVSKDKASTAVQHISACALAFKVVADPRRGVLVYVRVYSGSLDRGAALWNTNLQMTERAPKLMRMYANDAVDIESIQAGQIGVIPGLKFARTGDTLISYAGANPKTGPPGDVRTMQLKPIDVPPPVFFVSVEPQSLSEERAVKESLESLLREDPSLHVSVDQESGQTHLAGMGELHLEIARDRLVQDLKAKARIGRVEIGYREAITMASGEVTEVYDREVSGKTSKAACTVSISPIEDSEPTTSADHTSHLFDNNTLYISTPTLEEDGSPISSDTPGLPSTLPLPTVLQSLQSGVEAALARGPTHTFPIHSTSITLTLDPSSHIFPNTTPASLSSAARLAVQKALRTSASLSATTMMEPVMTVAIAVDEKSLGSVVHDISSARGGNVMSLDASEEESLTPGTLSEGPSVDVQRIYAPPDPFQGSSSSADVGVESAAGAGMRTVTARVPLKEMVGYLKHLRSLTGGRGTFTMAVDRFERMGSQRMKEVVKEMRGEYE